MADRTLIPQALTDTDFAPFGRVLQVPTDGRGGHAINEGRSQRFDLVADALLTAGAGRPVISISRALARSLPMALVEMARHRWGSQRFVPLGGRGLCPQAQTPIAASRSASATSERSLPRGPSSDKPIGAPSRVTSGRLSCGVPLKPAMHSMRIARLR